MSLCKWGSQAPCLRSFNFVSAMLVLEEIGSIMVTVALKNIDINTKESNPMTPP